MVDGVRLSGTRELKRRAIEALRKFAFDSAVNHSLKSIKGRNQVHKILQEEVDLLPPLWTSSSKYKICEDKLATTETGMKLQVLEDRDYLKQHYQISNNSGERSDVPKEEPGEENKKIEFLEKKEKRIFIRSRL